MKTIKIIDLLNKIANGEEVPKYIKYANYKNNKEDKMMVCKENIIYKLDQLEIHLNDEVEIIEEEKEIKKIKSNGYEFYSDINIWTKKEETVAYCECLMNKVNELIDAVNELKGKSE